MGEHLIDGEFQSDKYPTCPRGKVPLSCKDPTAQDLLWEYAQRRRAVDAEFASDVEAALRNAGYQPRPPAPISEKLKPFESAGLKGAAEEASLSQTRMREALLGRADRPTFSDAELAAYGRGLSKKDDAAYIARTLAAELCVTRAALSRLAALKPEPQGGEWVLVPREPTDAMVLAGRAFSNKGTYLSHPDVPWAGRKNGDDENRWSMEYSKKHFKAMIAAAPPPPVSDGEK